MQWRVRLALVIGALLEAMAMGSAGASGETLGAQIAEFAEEAQGRYRDERPPAALEYGRLRVYCSSDVEEIRAAGGTFSIGYAMSFSRGEPFGMERAEFDARMEELREMTRRAHEAGITVISYVSQNQSTSREGDPGGWIMSEVWADEEWWNRYADYYGARPEQPPSTWLQIRADGSYGGHVWIPPAATEERHYEVRGCPHSAAFRQYAAGIIKILVAAGIDGIYLDHSEIEDAFSEDSQRCFREFLGARYTPAELRERFGIADLDEMRPGDDAQDALGAERALFRAASEAEFHRYLRDVGREQDPDFIIAGNLWGGAGFQTAALNGSDIQLAGLVDTFLYSELATGTESPERGQRNLSGTRDGVRTSMAPLIRVLAASSRTGAATSYTYYPQSPNPVPTKEALFNLQRLAMAEAFANHTAFRRVEAHHVEPVRRAAKTVYDLLRSVEPEILGAEMCADVGVVASLQGCYHGRYSYHREVSRALADAGIAHEMVAPRNLREEGLARYRAVVLPNTAVLSREAYEALAEYARGGTVIAFGEVGVMDARGGPGPAGAGGKTGFVEVAIDPGRLAEDNRKADYDSGLTQHAAWARGEWPTVLRPTMEAVVAAVEQAAGESLTVRRHGPAGVEVSVMQRPGSDDLIVHAVNYGVDLAGAVTPAEEVRISVCAPGGKPITGVAWHPLDEAAEPARVIRKGDRVEFTVPSLGVYGIAIVKVRGE